MAAELPWINSWTANEDFARLDRGPAANEDGL